MPIPIPCVWNNIPYPSVSAAARACGISPGSMTHRLAMGYSCDADVPYLNKPSEFVWENIRFPNCVAAARAFGHHPATMQHRKRKGYACESDVPRNRFAPHLEPLDIDLNQVRASMRRGATLEIIAELNGVTRLHLIEAFRNEEKT